MVQHTSYVDLLTFNQLASAGITLGTHVTLINNPHVYEGIIFTTHKGKGPFLKELIESLPYKPAKIIFIDDKMDHVKAVHSAMQDSNIEILSVWYKAPEIRDQGYNLPVCLAQFKALFLENKILNSEEARKIADVESDPIYQLEHVLQAADLEALLSEFSLQLL